MSTASDGGWVRRYQLIDRMERESAAAAAAKTNTIVENIQKQHAFLYFCLTFFLSFFLPSYILRSIIRSIYQLAKQPIEMR